MLNCQNVSTFKKMLYCVFLFRLLNVRPSRNASNVFHNLDKISLFLQDLCDCSLCVTTDSYMDAVTPHKISVDNPLQTCRQMRILLCLSKIKNASWGGGGGGGAFPAGSPFSSHSPHSPLCPLCIATHFFFAQTISPNPQGEPARRLKLEMVSDRFLCFSKFS